MNFWIPIYICPNSFRYFFLIAQVSDSYNIALLTLVCITVFNSSSHDLHIFFDISFSMPWFALMHYLNTRSVVFYICFPPCLYLLTVIGSFLCKSLNKFHKLKHSILFLLFLLFFPHYTVHYNMVGDNMVDVYFSDDLSIE